MHGIVTAEQNAMKGRVKLANYSTSGMLSNVGSGSEPTGMAGQIYGIRSVIP